SWGPQAIGNHGAPVSLPKLKKAYEKGTRGISWGPLLTPGPRAAPEFPNGQSAPAVRSPGRVTQWFSTFLMPRPFNTVALHVGGLKCGQSHHQRAHIIFHE
ncbi:unnamed protein product, partial [Staurois parvus]